MCTPPRKARGGRRAISAAAGLTIGLLVAPPVRRLPAQPPGPRVLLMPASARALALGDAAVTSTDADALFYNPAMLATARGAVVSVQRDARRVTAGSVATLTTIGPVTIGVGAQHLDVGPGPTGPMPPGIAALSPIVPFGGSAFTIGVARGVRRAKVGLAARYVEERLGAERDGGVTLDAGVQMPLWMGTLGVSAQHLGGAPTVADGGGAHRVSIGWSAMRPVHAAWDLGVTTQLNVESDGFASPVGAVEAVFVPIQGVAIAARGGVRAPRHAEDAIATGGIGVTVDHLSLDYAIEPRRGNAPMVHRIGVRVR